MYKFHVKPNIVLPDFVEFSKRVLHGSNVLIKYNN